MSLLLDSDTVRTVLRSRDVLASTENDACRVTSAGVTQRPNPTISRNKIVLTVRYRYVVGTAKCVVGGG